MKFDMAYSATDAPVLLRGCARGPFRTPHSALRT